jgi:hypothetical protein
MDAQVRLWVLPRECGDFRKPRAGHHKTCRVDKPGSEAFDDCCVHGMCNRQVIGVHYEKALVWSIAQPNTQKPIMLEHILRTLNQ